MELMYISLWNTIYNEYILFMKSTIWNSISENVVSPNNMYQIKCVFTVLTFSEKDGKNQADFLLSNIRLYNKDTSKTLSFSFENDIFLPAIKKMTW